MYIQFDFNCAYMSKRNVTYICIHTKPKPISIKIGEECFAGIQSKFARQYIDRIHDSRRAK